MSKEGFRGLAPFDKELVIIREPLTPEYDQALDQFLALESKENELQLEQLFGFLTVDRPVETNLPPPVPVLAPAPVEEDEEHFRVFDDELLHLDVAPPAPAVQEEYPVHFHNPEVPDLQYHKFTDTQIRPQWSKGANYRVVAKCWFLRDFYTVLLELSAPHDAFLREGKTIECMTKLMELKKDVPVWILAGKLGNNPHHQQVFFEYEGRYMFRIHLHKALYPERQPIQEAPPVDGNRRAFDKARENTKRSMTYLSSLDQEGNVKRSRSQ